ncbi:signal recognition particle-docking protein FtsY [Dokdonella sp. MW10]|uniref:signal recognition particle-docking protein FtsY n=1 Tax=Dokdonella sp. MW10 TaxID=2992926 RepID=UPI003F7F5531
MLKFWKKKDAPAAATAPEPDAPAAPAGEDVALVEPGMISADVLAPQPPVVEPMPVPEHPAAAEPAAPARRSWRERLAGSGFARSLGSLFVRHAKLDDEFLDTLETALITADVGVGASTDLIARLRKRVDKREFADAGALLAALRSELLGMLAGVEKPLDVRGRAPFVLLTVGVNGVGKTTTIGKLAHRFQSEGRSLMLAAGDTFRAAAVEQLQTWGARNNVPVVAQGSGADSASVIFDALQAARSRGTELLIADTAGRLHTQTGLMDELSKIRRVLAKLDPEAPHEVLMVIDGTTGQNAISQVRQFREAIGVTGLVVTKLDGTAKGGVVFALAREFGLPIRFVGLGEGIEDLRTFDARAFVEGLLPASLG